MKLSKLSGGAVVLRIVAFLLFILAASWGAHLVREALNLQILPENEQRMHRVIVVGMFAYVGLLAMPFVPGAEIGIAMLTAFGAVIAPLVYAATVSAMMLAYIVGRFVPVVHLARLLSLFRLRRASELVAQAAPLSGVDRLALVLESASDGAIGLALRHRYVALGLLVNLPGNAIIGGGGGIMMLAGMSGLFAPLPTLLAVLIAVAPVPLAVYALGL